MTHDQTSARWLKIKRLFQETLTKPSDERSAFLHDACDNDADLLSEVQQLLRAAEQTGQSFEDIVGKAAQDADEARAINERIGQYKVIKLIGEGGMGQVYLAERADKQYQQTVAIKVLGVRRPTTDLVNRFRAERQILASLDHPNIAHLLDGGETDDGAPFLVMEYVDGEAVDEYCDVKQLTTRERIQLFVQICDAVDHAHRNLIIHRDIKPSNILVADSGSVKLLDFGIAKLLEPEPGSIETRSGARVLSPMHASPEQVRGQKITVASDIYSLGVLLYQLLTGRHPYQFDVSDPTDIERAICQSEPTRPSARLTQDHSTSAQDINQLATDRGTNVVELRKTLHGDLDNILLTTLDKDPERRYASVRELTADLQRFLEHRPVLARSATLPYLTGKFIRRNRLPVLITTTALMLLGTAVGVSVNRITNERDIATAERKKALVVSEFLQDVFASADPSLARGEETTARELVEAGIQKTRNNLDEAPATRATMLRVLAEVSYGLGNHEQAKTLANDALKIAEALTVPPLDDIARTKLILGFVVQDLTDWDLAETLFQDALDIRQKLYGPAHPTIVEVISAQAHLIEFQGNLKNARDRYQQALDMSKVIASGDDAYTAEIQTKLAGVYRRLLEADRAEELLLDSMAMQQRLFGDLHPDLADTKRHLAGVYRDTRDFVKSEALYLEVIEERIKMLGPNHQEVSHTYNSYSQMLSDKGDLAGAVAASKEFMRILEHNHKTPNANHGAAYNNLASLQVKLKDYDAALENFQKAANVQDFVGLAPDHLHRSFPLYGMANTYRQKGDYSEAEITYRKVLPMRRQHFDEDHLFVSQVKTGLAASLIDLGKLEEARNLLLDVLPILEREQGTDHPQTINARKNMTRLEGAL